MDIIYCNFFEALLDLPPPPCLGSQADILVPPPLNLPVENFTCKGFLFFWQVEGAGCGGRLPNAKTAEDMQKLAVVFSLHTLGSTFHGNVMFWKG